MFTDTLFLTSLSDFYSPHGTLHATASCSQKDWRSRLKTPAIHTAYSFLS